MARSCRLALLGLTLTSLGATRAQAEDYLAPVRVTYRAPAECPGEQEFEARVLARTGKDGLYPDGNAPFELFEIELTPTPERTRGRLTTHMRGAYPTVREIQAGTCREAVDALALIVALTLDPASVAKTGETTGAGGTSGAGGNTNAGGSTSGATSESGSAGKSGEGGSGQAGSESSAGEAGAAGSAGSTSVIEPPPDDHGNGAASPFHVEGTASGIVLSGVTPELLFGGDLAAAVVFPFIVDPGALLEVGVRLTLDQTEITEQGDATFEFWTLHAALCPQVLAPTDWLWLVPCANVEYGRVQADGSNTLNQVSTDRAWLTLGPRGLVQAFVFSPLFVQLGGELNFALLRQRYVLGPLEVHETPPLVFRAELGLGVRL